MGKIVGISEGDLVGILEGKRDGSDVGIKGEPEGVKVGLSVGTFVGDEGRNEG